MEPRFNEPLYNEVVGIMNDILQLGLLKCMEKNLDITNHLYNEPIFLVPWYFVRNLGSTVPQFLANCRRLVINSTLFCHLAEPLDGQWGSWTAWTTCSKTCGISGGELLRRTRLCNGPPPMNGGKPCVGEATETARACFTPCKG